eukprot:CAMPEP_0170195844 /NCGR_PEP_ID=MMETSP0040_2-20121228/62406_1 /TAXON_ID=641309 /ORGANISM="Lotharella oceanica, Strain CCMP622" /LENGTH=96 /DNA_ID=CAMNT_0010445115 /DNA_START=26 /DNA_END=316 /DNA_ORIENTATION=-
MHHGKPPPEYDDFPRCDDCDKIIRRMFQYFHCLKCQWDCCSECMDKRIQLKEDGVLDSDVTVSQQADNNNKPKDNVDREMMRKIKQDEIMDVIRDL